MAASAALACGYYLGLPLRGCRALCARFLEYKCVRLRVGVGNLGMLLCMHRPWCYKGGSRRVAAASLCMIRILEIYAKTDVDARHVQVFAGFYVLVAGLHVGIACAEVYADAGGDCHATAHGRAHICARKFTCHRVAAFHVDKRSEFGFENDFMPVSGFRHIGLCGAVRAGC